MFSYNINDSTILWMFYSYHIYEDSFFLCILIECVIFFLFKCTNCHPHFKFHKKVLNFLVNLLYKILFVLHFNAILIKLNKGKIEKKIREEIWCGSLYCKIQKKMYKGLVTWSHQRMSWTRKVIAFHASKDALNEHRNYLKLFNT
jgi:hypothetical protein